MTTICVVLLSIANSYFSIHMHPRRVCVSPHGRIELGTCDANSYLTAGPNGSTAISYGQCKVIHYCRQYVKGQDQNDVGHDTVRSSTCEGAIFRGDATGRLALRVNGSSVARVLLDTPRLSLTYRRLHHCYTKYEIVYLSSCFFVDGSDAFGSIIDIVPLHMIDMIPKQGTSEAAHDRTHTACFWQQIAASRKFNGPAISSIIPVSRLNSTHFDFSCLSKDEIFLYIIDKGMLVQYRHVRPKPGDAIQHQRWEMRQRIPTTINGPFWVVQVSPKYFVTVEMTGRFIEYHLTGSAAKVRVLADSGRDVLITHMPDKASVTSSNYAFELSRFGIAVPIRQELPSTSPVPKSGVPPLNTPK